LKLASQIIPRNRWQGGGDPCPHGHDLALALNSTIEEKFNVVNLEKYLRIIKKRERLLPEYEDKKKK
jgi:hypothetical protein